jgi:hypothetical protein
MLEEPGEQFDPRWARESVVSDSFEQWLFEQVLSTHASD